MINNLFIAKNLKYLFWVISLVLFLFFIFALINTPLLAQDDKYGINQTQNTAKLPTGDVPTVLGRLAGAALALSGSLFLFLIIYGGILIMTAAGEQGRIDKGKKIITWTIIGAIIIGSAYAITNLVFTALR